jgi:hypothetical protein
MENRVYAGAIGLVMLMAQAGFAGEADVIGVSVKKSACGIYGFDVTVKHADTGWDRYADNWEIVGPDGTVIDKRVLLHPHVGEQPFTRSISRVEVPDGVRSVITRARDSVHGHGGTEKTIQLPQ